MDNEVPKAGWYSSARAVSSPDAASPKRKKFVKLAEARTVRAVKAIRVIGNLGNRAVYSYTEADVHKIVEALNGEIEALQKRMAGPARSGEVDFSL